jgi:hypothetical protein
MGDTQSIETDYLVVGAGAAAMSFVDTLIEHTDADVVMVERRHRPGGHWLDSYPFVQLHQPSSFYGVSSTPLGQGRIDAAGPEAGFSERASGFEICGYFDDLMRNRLLPSGRVRFFPKSDHLGDGRFRSMLTDQVTETTVRRAVVDATYMMTRVPATDPPPFEVAEGARCIPVGELTAVQDPPAGYDIIGGGKTALDAIGWLLDCGTPPEQIRWIRPRDSWLLNRAYFQPGDQTLETLRSVVYQLEAMVECDTVDEVYDRLEQQGVMLRTDPSVRPGLMRGATISVAEVEQLQRITDVVRLGYVERIGSDEIVLTEGTIPTSADRLHVHCAAAGLADNPPVPIFGDATITLQPVTRVSLPLSAALVGFVESTDRTIDEKNALCPPNPWPQTPFDYLRSVLNGMKTEAGWLESSDLQAFVDESRLNLLHDLQTVDATQRRELQGRLLTALFPAMERFELLAAQATPAERARILAPA